MSIFSKIIGAIPRTADNAHLQFFASIKNALEEINSKLSVTKSGMVHQTGNASQTEALETIAQNATNITDLIDNGFDNLDGRQPPAVVNLSASTGRTNEVFLSWQFTSPVNISNYEVWRSADINFGNAVLLAAPNARMYTDVIGPAQSYYYWVRAISTGNTNGLFNASVNGTTSTDPIQDYLNISGNITSSQLSATLQGTISSTVLLDGLRTDLDQEISDRITNDTTNLNTLASSIVTEKADAIYQANQQAIALTDLETTQRVEGDLAESRIRELEFAKTNTDVASNTAALNLEIINRTDADLAESVIRTNQFATLDTAVASNAAAIIEESNARTTADAVEAGRSSVIFAELNDNHANAMAAIAEEQHARVAADLAEAQSRSLVTSELNGKVATVEGQMNTKVDTATAEAEYTLKTQVVNATTGQRVVSGFGAFASTTGESKFIINANQFGLLPQGSQDTTLFDANGNILPLVPFAVDATTGKTVMQSAFIPTLTSDNIDVNFTLTANQIDVTGSGEQIGLSAISAEIGVINSGKLRSGSADNSSKLVVDLNNEQIIIRDENLNIRVKIGKL